MDSKVISVKWKNPISLYNSFIDLKTDIKNVLQHRVYHIARKVPIWKVLELHFLSSIAFPKSTQRAIHKHVGVNLKKVRLIIIILIFPILSTFGQDYKIVDSDSILVKTKIDSVKIVEAYTLDNFEYYVGWYENKNQKDYGLRLYAFNPKGNLIYKSNSFMDSYTHSLTFFKSDKMPNQTIILGHSSNEYSWGNEVYLLKNGKLSHIGLLDIGTYNSFDESWDISKYTQIWTESNQIRFTFSRDSLTYNPGGKNERILTNQQIQYLYKNGELKEKIKN